MRQGTAFKNCSPAFSVLILLPCVIGESSHAILLLHCSPNFAPQVYGAGGDGQAVYCIDPKQTLPQVRSSNAKSSYRSAHRRSDAGEPLI